MLRLFISLVVASMVCASLSPALAQQPAKKAKVFIGYIDSIGLPLQKDALKRLVGQVAETLRHRASIESPAARESWDIVRDSKWLVQLEATHFVIAITEITSEGGKENALRVRWHIGLLAPDPSGAANSPVLVFVTILGQSAEALITQDGAVRNWDVGARDFVAPPVTATAEGIGKAIKLFFPELASAYKYYPSCFKPANTPPPDFSQRSIELLANIIDNIHRNHSDGFEYPKSKFTPSEEAHRICKGLIDSEMQSSADFLLEGVADRQPRRMILRITVDDQARVRRRKERVYFMPPPLSDQYEQARTAYHANFQLAFTFCPDTNAWSRDLAPVAQELVTLIRHQLLRDAAAPSSRCPPQHRMQNGRKSYGR